MGENEVNEIGWKLEEMPHRGSVSWKIAGRNSACGIWLGSFSPREMATARLPLDVLELIVAHVPLRPRLLVLSFQSDGRRLCWRR